MASVLFPNNNILQQFMLKYYVKYLSSFQPMHEKTYGLNYHLKKWMHIINIPMWDAVNKLRKQT